jgi:hypothetical protein
MNFSPRIAQMVFAAVLLTNLAFANPAAAETVDRAYALDSSASKLIFGNGISGNRPAGGTSSAAAYGTGLGSSGNVTQSIVFRPVSRVPCAAMGC